MTNIRWVRKKTRNIICIVMLVWVAFHLYYWCMCEGVYLHVYGAYVFFVVYYGVYAQPMQDLTSGKWEEISDKHERIWVLFPHISEFFRRSLLLEKSKSWSCRRTVNAWDCEVLSAIPRWRWVVLLFQYGRCRKRNYDYEKKTCFVIFGAPFTRYSAHTKTNICNICTHTE